MPQARVDLSGLNGKIAFIYFVLFDDSKIVTISDHTHTHPPASED